MAEWSKALISNIRLNFYQQGFKSRLVRQFARELTSDRQNEHSININCLQLILILKKTESN